MAQRILAIELAGDRVRAALAERAWSTFQFLGTFEKVRANDEPDLSGALKRLAGEAGPVDIVISSLSGSLVVKRLLELPFADMRRLHQVVPYELEEHLPFPVDDGLVAFARVGTNGEKTLVMAAMARKQDLEAHIALLAGAGLDPKIVTLAPLALAALFGRAQNGATPTSHLVIEADQSFTSMVLLDSAGMPRALRTLDRSLLSPDGTPAPLNVSNAVVASVRQTLLAHGSDGEQTDLILAGTASAAPAVRSMLSDALAIAVRDPTEFDYSAIFENGTPASGRFASCVAMLLGEMPSRPVELLNFRQGQFAFRGSVRGDFSPFYTSGILAGVALLFALIHFGFGVAAGLHQLHLINEQISAVTRPVLGPTDPAQAVTTLRSGIAQMDKRLKLIGGNLAHHSPLETLAVVSRALPARFPVEIEDYQLDENGVHMSGQADSYTTVDQAKRALDMSDYFGAIEVSHAKAGTDASKVDFKIDATFKDAVAPSTPSSSDQGDN
ncbi:MAG TPA: type II secretion system protein GspL [Candidatus Binataceae bacterium]|nr:type II secretion system protein GspL [Candidatus Binataceae bacterium]